MSSLLYRNVYGNNDLCTVYCTERPCTEVHDNTEVWWHHYLTPKPNLSFTGLFFHCPFWLSHLLLASSLLIPLLQDVKLVKRIKNMTESKCYQECWAPAESVDEGGYVCSLPHDSQLLLPDFIDLLHEWLLQSGHLYHFDALKHLWHHLCSFVLEFQLLRLWK